MHRSAVTASSLSATAARAVAASKEATSSSKLASALHCSVRVVTSTYRSAFGTERRRLCSTWRKFVRAWASVESGHRRNASRSRACGACRWRRSNVSSDAVRAESSGGSSTPPTRRLRRRAPGPRACPRRLPRRRIRAGAEPPSEVPVSDAVPPAVNRDELDVEWSRKTAGRYSRP
jgi:hypothetical protein